MAQMMQFLAVMGMAWAVRVQPPESDWSIGTQPPDMDS
jgi:hypothetical protein